MEILMNFNSLELLSFISYLHVSNRKKPCLITLFVAFIHFFPFSDKNSHHNTFPIIWYCTYNVHQWCCCTPHLLSLESRQIKGANTTFLHVLLHKFRTSFYTRQWSILTRIFRVTNQLETKTDIAWALCFISQIVWMSWSTVPIPSKQLLHASVEHCPSLQERSMEFSF